MKIPELMRGEQYKKYFWNGYSSRFDLIYSGHNKGVNHLLNSLFRKSIKLRFLKTMENLPLTADSVLDIGCGPGYYCIELAKKKCCRILGIDFSEQMISLAKSNSAIEGCSEKVEFKVLNFLSWHPSEKFDYLIMMGFIEYIEDPVTALNKAIAMTKQKLFISFPVDGGLLAFQRKWRYRNRCYLKLYFYKELQFLLSGLNIAAFTIEKVARDYFVTLTI